MQNQNFQKQGKSKGFDIILSILIGIVAYLISFCCHSGLADPLLLAMFGGMLINLIIGKKRKWGSGFTVAIKYFIPIGIFFYGLHNLNFVIFSQVSIKIIALVIVIILVYYGTILFLGKIFKQKKEVTYLLATGSAICGASAIVATSPAVEAESDDISLSLVSIVLAAIFALFILFPFLAVVFALSNYSYAVLAGSILQFTGFVKAAMTNLPPLSSALTSSQAIRLALSIKAIRYLGLLIAIPLFASLVKNKIIFPWFLWVFLGAGFLSSVIYLYNQYIYQVFLSIVKPFYVVLWSIAMGSVGLNTDLSQLLSNNGLKSLAMAFLGMGAAIIVFVLVFLMIL